MTPDVNVLVAASRSDHPHHAVALTWLEQALEACERGASLEILPMVAAGFLRLVTNPKVFPHATPIAEALRFLRAILDTPGVSMPELGREWPSLERQCLAEKLSGNQIPDAWIAAAVMTGGLHLVSFDRGFARLLNRSQHSLLKP